MLRPHPPTLPYGIKVMGNRSGESAEGGGTQDFRLGRSSSFDVCRAETSPTENFLLSLNCSLLLAEIFGITVHHHG